MKKILVDYYAVLLQVKDPKVRAWYEKEAAEQTWSIRTLQRNVSSQYYYRMHQTQKQELVEKEMKELTAEYQNDKLEFIMNPVVAEFLGLASNTKSKHKRQCSAFSRKKTLPRRLKRKRDCRKII